MAHGVNPYGPLGTDGPDFPLYHHVPVDPAFVDEQTRRAIAECPWHLLICGVSMGIYPNTIIPQRIINGERNNGHDVSTAVIRLATFDEIRPGVENSCRSAEYWRAEMQALDERRAIRKARWVSKVTPQTP